MRFGVTQYGPSLLAVIAGQVSSFERSCIMHDDDERKWEWYGHGFGYWGSYELWISADGA